MSNDKHVYSFTLPQSLKRTGENVCLLVKQKSLTESISEQRERERILDSIKVTASPIGTPLAEPLFTQIVHLCMKESEQMSE